MPRPLVSVTTPEMAMFLENGMISTVRTTLRIACTVTRSVEEEPATFAAKI